MACAQKTVTTNGNVTKNATRYRIHKHQRRNAATFNYPPAGLKNLYWNDPCLLSTLSNWWMNHCSQLSMHGIFSTTSLGQTNLYRCGKPTVCKSASLGSHGFSTSMLVDRRVHVKITSLANDHSEVRMGWQPSQSVVIVIG